jgi:hypothetical protein
LRSQVIERAGGVCEYCLIDAADTFFGCQIEHIIAEKHGGMTEADNLAYACVFCNRFKGSDIASIHHSTGRLCRFFNPRADRWFDHFVLEGIRIRPLTDIREVTADILRINAFERLLEREALVAAGRYPSRTAILKMSQ